jgi:hypothetical protein
MIRKLTKDDVPDLVKVCRDFHGSSNLQGFTFNEESALFILDAIVEVDSVFAYGAYYDDVLVGGLLAEATGHPFMDMCIAKDLGFFMQKERRGAIDAKRLLTKFKSWCAEKSVDVTQITVDAGISNDRTCQFLGHMGYVDTGNLMTIGV